MRTDVALFLAGCVLLLAGSHNGLTVAPPERYMGGVQRITCPRWWDWDPHLTTVAILLMAFLGIMALRRFMDDPLKRASWSSVATVIGFTDVPMVDFSVKWWNWLHQQQSSLATVTRAFAQTEVRRITPQR